jgi:hypothetical protein
VCNEGHGIITQVALSVVPEELHVSLGSEARALAERYAYIPDEVYRVPEYRPFASVPWVEHFYVEGLHLPGAPDEHLRILEYFTARAMKAVKEGRVWMGHIFGHLVPCGGGLGVSGACFPATTCSP